jgi:hypothetical protein
MPSKHNLQQAVSGAAPAKTINVTSVAMRSTEELMQAFHQISIF